MPRMFIPESALTPLVTAANYFAEQGARREAAILDELARRLTAATVDWREVDTYLAPSKVIPIGRRRVK